MTMDLDRIPDTMLAWPLFGAGIENLGVDGKPARWPTPRPAPDQILVRSDAVGLCYSDVKVIRQGGSHPRLYGRDLARRPVVQGHEVTVTVVEVGEAWRDRYRPGQRFAIQADFYYRGRNLAYGYVFTGGLAQYSLLGAAALDGDEGSYIIPVPEGLGYAEVALTEPWACVEAAYVPRRRLHVKADGVTVDRRPARAGGRVPAGRDADRHPAAQDHRDRRPGRAARPDHLARAGAARWLDPGGLRGAWPRPRRTAASTTSSCSTRPRRCSMGCPRRSRPAA